MAKVTEYPRITKMKDNDILLVDGPDGTRTILKNNAAKDLGGEVIAVTKSGNKDKVTLNLTDSPVDLATEKDLDEVADALLPIGTASGNPAIITDAKLGTTFKMLKVNVEPVQAGSGDPSPDNVREISGWTGANIRVSPTNSQTGGQTYSVTFPTEAGTVGGGVLDLTAGTLTVNKFYALIRATGKKDNFFFASSTALGLPNIAGLNAGLLCNRYPVASNVQETRTTPGITFYTSRIIRMLEPAYIDKTVEEYNAMLENNPVEIVYDLAEPIVYQLTPQQIEALAGYNAVFADCGPVELAYVKDVKIEEMIAEESDGTASRAFTAGEHVIVKDKLYKVTTDVSSGTALVPGTNIEETTVGDELNDAARKADIDNALAEINESEGENVQFVSYGSMKDLYEKAGTSEQGTKQLINDEIVFTPTSGRSSAAYINYLMGSTTSPIDNYIANPRVKNKVVVDVWYSTNSTKYNGVIRCAEAPIFWYFSLTVGNNMHARFSLDLDGKTLQHIGVQYNAASVTDTEFITIRKFMVWYGEDAFINPVVIAENTVRPVKYNKILSIGDSLTNVVNPTGTAYVGDWQAKLANILHIPNRQKLGVAGTALSKYPESGEGSENSIYAKIQALQSDESVDLITLWGGTNDWHTTAIPLSDFETELPTGTRNDSSFYGGALTDVETLISKFPKARIIIVGTTPRSWDNTKNSRTTPNGNGKYLQEYNDALKTIAEYYGLPFIDLMKTSGINTMNITNYMVAQTDPNDNTTYYLHFNQAGEEAISKRLAYFINSVG